MSPESIVADSPACAVCLEPATSHVNITASAASSVPSVMEPRCEIHNPYSAVSRKASADQRLRDAAPLLFEAGRRLLAQLKIAPTVCCGMYDEGHTDDCPQEALRAALLAAAPAAPTGEGSGS